jgi:hypothetical protein
VTELSVRTFTAVQGEAGSADLKMFGCTSHFIDLPEGGLSYWCPVGADLSPEPGDQGFLQRRFDDGRAMRSAHTGGSSSAP